MKSLAVRFLKILLAGCLAFVILNLLAQAYRGSSLTIVDETMSTPMRHEPYSFFSAMQEGFTFGYHDQNGFNNAYPAKDSVDYLCLGSSQTEAKQVMPDENYVYQLNKLIDQTDGAEGYAYSIGTAGENLDECVHRLKHAVDTYQPRKAVIIESVLLDFSQDKIDRALEEAKVGAVMNAGRGKLLDAVTRLPFLRLVYAQAEEMMSGGAADDRAQAAAPEETVFDFADYEKRMGPLLDRAVESARGVPVIIVYVPKLVLSSDGALSLRDGAELIRAFQRLCEARGIVFLDMSDRYFRDYEADYTLPYGFANSSVGRGHLNKYGHAMIAEELLRVLGEVK